MNLSLSRVMAAQADRLTLTFHVVLAASVFVFLTVMVLAPAR